MRPGTKVVIVEDCRAGGAATGEVGIYEGDFLVSVGGDAFENPRIRLEDGTVIYGIECWWKPIDDIPLEQSQKELHDLRKYLKEIGCYK